VTNPLRTADVVDAVLRSSWPGRTQPPDRGEEVDAGAGQRSERPPNSVHGLSGFSARSVHRAIGEPAREAAPVPPPVLEVVVPVHNEEVGVEFCLRRLHAHLTSPFPFSFRITVVENASTDGTVEIVRRVADELPDIELLVLSDPGRGRALRTAWLTSDAAVLAYMDVDLSTDLAGLLPLVAPLISGHSDLAIGTRLSRSSRVVRGPKREVISRGYNLLLRGTRTMSLSDAQCGFKAIRADIAERLLPLVEDDGWFFDTELLFLAERVGLRVHEVPVDWVDDPDSRVNIVRTARADLAGIVRLRRSLISGRLPIAGLRAGLGRRPLAARTPEVPSSAVRQLAAFTVIGAMSTAAYLLLFLLLGRIGTAQVANLGALLTTAVGNTAANRRVTFGVRGRAGAGRAQAGGLVVFAVGLALTSGSLAVLHAVTPTPSRTVAVGVLILANLVATLVRFSLLRVWVFRSAGSPDMEPGATSVQRPVTLTAA
jgi:putative flippase GtrA